MNVLSKASAALLMIGFGLTVVYGVAPANAGSNAPSFTSAQAQKGQGVYNANCALCHGANLEGVYAPALNGPNGNVQWQSVSAVYAYTTTQMPVANAGGLSSADYVDIMAFLLREHGHRPGSAELTSSAAAESTTLLGPP
jgi:polar amino acid transport system substrate-binding protein